VQIQYTRPPLYPKQSRAIFNDKRWSLVEASTKSGKTVASIAWILEGAFGDKAGENSWWVAPVSEQARIAFTRVKQNLTSGSFSSRESPIPTITLINGAILTFRSADNPDSLYGEDVKRVVIDEASRMKNEAWYAIRSTLTATNGKAVIIGNVNGRYNWFYEFCREAEAGRDPNANYSRITWRDAVDAGVLDIEEIEDAQRRLPEQVFRELYEAEATDDGLNPFGIDHIRMCIDNDSDTQSSIPVAFGWDLAKTEDYTVGIGLDRDCHVCRFWRWQTSWEITISRIREMTGQVPALVDATGVGDPIIEALRAGNPASNFRGFKFAAKSKQQIVEDLAVAIQKHDIAFPAGEITRELERFESKDTPFGVRYQAGYGHHDDCVMALALALKQFRSLGRRQDFMARVTWPVPHFIPIFGR
jgi:phage FluMu gp28-like protein